MSIIKRIVQRYYYKIRGNEPICCWARIYEEYMISTLLHLAPNSTDAKVFEDFVKGDKAANIEMEQIHQTTENRGGQMTKVREQGEIGM
ncbi:hypothetical protein Leryth_003971 [Lithospermum erythrorhizon]|nr:hypothetical protein Leryth_003971 [Lithospermum erythrorhizon]